ncbi:MAG: hypothetical protein KIS92_18215 [Planctomycetota bacterium]|nr:hypothetical protein [Planctomycetota bacterium]
MNGTTREKRFCRAVLFGEAPDAPETPNAGELAGEPRAHAGAEAAAAAVAQADADLPERDRAAAEAVRALFRRELAAPPFDRAKLLKALHARASAATASPAPFSIVERPRVRAWRIAAVAALLAVAVGVAWVLLCSPDGTDFATKPPVPPPGPRLAAERLPDGRWRYGEAATLTPREGSRVQARDDGVMDLRAGRAELVSDGHARARVEVLAALDGNVRVSVLGPSRSGLRVLPGGRGLAFSVYEGARASVVFLTPLVKWPPTFAGRDEDGIVFVEDQARERGSRCALWPDVTAALPPVTPGDVYLRLANGSIVRGRVTARTEESVQVLGARTPVPEAGPGTDPAPGAETPETFLAREVAAWTPAETPRGRDTYARWLDECAAAQLLDARRAWLVYLSELDVGRAHERTPAEFLATQRPLPETDLRLARRGDAPVLQLVPRDPEFGPGWELNERGEVTRIAPDEAVKGQEF